MRSVSLAVALMLAAPAPCFAGAENLTPGFRQLAVQNCTGDAVRLCPTTLLDEQQTAACMKANRAQLSPSCRAVFDRGMRASRR